MISVPLRLDLCIIPDCPTTPSSFTTCILNNAYCAFQIHLLNIRFQFLEHHVKSKIPSAPNCNWPAATQSDDNRLLSRQETHTRRSRYSHANQHLCHRLRRTISRLQLFQRRIQSILWSLPTKTRKRSY